MKGQAVGEPADQPASLLAAAEVCSPAQPAEGQPGHGQQQQGQVHWPVAVELPHLLHLGQLGTVDQQHSTPLAAAVAESEAAVEVVQVVAAW